MGFQDPVEMICEFFELFQQDARKYGVRHFFSFWRSIAFHLLGRAYYSTTDEVSGEH